MPGFVVSLRHCLAQASSPKALKIITCKKLTNFIMELLYTRIFVLVTSNDRKSRPHMLKNGVPPQGSVLAPTMYNIYTSDFPITVADRYMYADDIALTIAGPTFKQVEDIISHDMNIVQNYLKRWRLKLSKNKTVSSALHIRSHQVNKQLKLCLDQQQTTKYEPTPKYLGINLDRSLTLKHHIEQLKSEVSASVPSYTTG